VICWREEVDKSAFDMMVEVGGTREGDEVFEACTEANVPE
jgi:hypothetical protein